MFPVSLSISVVPAYPQEQVLHPEATPIAETEDDDHHAQHTHSSVGRAGFERLLEQERYRIPFNIENPQALKALLRDFANKSADPSLNTPFVVISGGGIVGLLVAIFLREYEGYNVLVVEKRPNACRQNVLELKRFTLKEWPPALIELLVKEKLITRSLCRAESLGERKVLRHNHPRSIIADLAAPQPPSYQAIKPLPPSANNAPGPWAYPDPARESDSDFHTPYALTQTRDAQVGLSRYCRQIGVHLLMGEIAELAGDDGEFVPGIRMGDGTDEAGETIRPPASLPALVVIAEGNTPRIDNFGGIDSIDVDEVWHQRNYPARHNGNNIGTGGGNSIEFDKNSEAVVITQVWDGPDGLQANVSVLPTLRHAARMRAMSPADAERELDAIFERAPMLLASLPTPIIVEWSQEIWRSPPIPINLTRARNPIHGNVVFLGDSPGLGSPFNSRGVNDGATGQLRILREYIRDPRYLSADPLLRRAAENLARTRFNDVYRVRHGTALDLMLQFGFYTEQQVAEIKASFAKERRTS